MSVMSAIATDPSPVIDVANFEQLDKGWDLFDVNGSELYEIQRDDEMAIFASDDDAIDHVRKHAALGSKRHIEALAVHDRDAPLLAKARSAE